MIKKSVFEDELIHGMQRELQAHDKKQGMQDLVKAADYLNAAVEIFEEAGLNAKADQVLRILGKIALAQDEQAAGHDTKVKMMPSMKALMEKGVTHEDLRGVGKGDAFSKARVSTAFRALGYTDKEIGNLIGAHNVMSEDEAADLLDPNRSFGKIKNWIENPTAPIDPSNLQPGEEISLQSALPKKEHAPSPEDLVFRSIAQELGLVDDNDAKGKPRKPKDPTKVHDGHTHGLTSERMLENLKGHGTPFNMADDHNVDIEQPESFDEDYQKWLAMRPAPKLRTRDIDPDLVGLIQADDSDSDDLLNVEIGNDLLEVSEGDPEKTFEDSD